MCVNLNDQSKRRMGLPKPLVPLRRGGAAFRGCGDRGRQRQRESRGRGERRKETAVMCVTVR